MTKLQTNILLVFMGASIFLALALSAPTPYDIQLCVQHTGHSASQCQSELIR